MNPQIVVVLQDDSSFNFWSEVLAVFVAGLAATAVSAVGWGIWWFFDLQRLLGGSLRERRERVQEEREQTQLKALKTSIEGKDAERSKFDQRMNTIREAVRGFKPVLLRQRPELDHSDWALPERLLLQSIDTDWNTSLDAQLEELVSKVSQDRQFDEALEQAVVQGLIQLRQQCEETVKQLSSEKHRLEEERSDLLTVRQSRKIEE